MQHDHAAPSATHEDVAAVEHLKKSYQAIRAELGKVIVGQEP